MLEYRVDPQHKQNLALLQSQREYKPNITYLTSIPSYVLVCPLEGDLEQTDTNQQTYRLGSEVISSTQILQSTLTRQYTCFYSHVSIRDYIHTYIIAAETINWNAKVKKQDNRIDLDDSDTTQEDLQDYVTTKAYTYETENLVDTDLWDIFRDDFNGQTRNVFSKL